MQEKGMTEEASLVFALLALAAAKAQVDLFSGTIGGWMMMMVVAVKTTCIRAPLFAAFSTASDGGLKQQLPRS